MEKIKARQTNSPTNFMIADLDEARWNTDYAAHDIRYLYDKFIISIHLIFNKKKKKFIQHNRKIFKGNAPSSHIIDVIYVV